ncbi:MAG: arginine--tRNA ligase [bacterium]
MYLIEKAKTEILLALKAALNKTYTPTFDDLESPKDGKMGDVAFPCFRLAKGMGRNPAEVASEYAAKILPRDLVREARAVGPYINFFMNIDAVAADSNKQISLLKSKYGENHGTKRTVMFEYSGLNTHKPSHVGHLRNQLFGASVVRLMRSQGIKVIAADFVNDLGLHVAQWLWCYKTYHFGEKPPKTELGKWMSGIYTEAVKKYEEMGTAKEAVMDVLKKLQHGDKETMKLWKETRKWSLKEFDAFHEELGAKFDTFYAESDFVEKRMKIVEKLLDKKIAIQSEGAIIVNLEDVGLGIFVILRTDGTALYSTTDLALAIQKFEDYKIDASYVATDARQKQHFASVFEILKRLGYKKEMIHVAYEFVTLPEGAMSSRKGTVILYEDFRNELISVARAETKSRHLDWSEKNINKVAHAIAFGAMKFEILKQDPDKVITFDIKSAMSFDGFSGPYLQYTAARINGIVKKTKAPKKGTKSALVRDENERELIWELAKYPEVARLAALELKPSIIAHYLFKIAKLFAAFYESVPVSTSSDGERALHLSVLSDLKTVLENGLALLGIEVVKEM